MYSPKFMRVYITEQCNAHCYNCFNKHFRRNLEMPYFLFEDICKYLSTNGIKILKILGGEPTLHSQWEKVIDCSQKYFESISIFSNGILMDKLKSIKLRSSDNLILNFSFYKNWDIESLANLKCIFSIKIEPHLDIESQKDYLKELSNKGGCFSLNLSLDCTENIFKSNIQEYIDKTEEWINFAKENNIKIVLDHGIPKCLLDNKDLSIDSRYFFSNKGMCSLDNGGLISSDGGVHFCPNYMDSSFYIQDKKGDFIPWSVFKDNLNKIYILKCMEAYRRICKGCKDFNNSCNGNCWASQKFT